LPREPAAKPAGPPRVPPDTAPPGSAALDQSESVS
jgi:hypothetical protein